MAATERPDPMPLDEALDLWTEGFCTHEIRAAAGLLVDGHSPTSDVFSRAAATLLQAVQRHSRPAPVLWSGISDPASLRWQAGQQLRFSLQSFSASRRAALFFASALVILELPASRAFPVAQFSAHPLEAEWLVSGKFQISRIEPDPDDYPRRLVWICPMTAT